MTLPAAPNSISMSQMNTEIQRSSTAQLSMSDATVNGIISNSPGTQISFSELRGQSYETISISDVTVASVRFLGGTAQSIYELQSDGDIQRQVNTTSTDIGDWITPKNNMANYECRATLQSGQAPSVGTLNTWMALSSSRSWTLFRGSGVGTSTSVLLIEIRRASDGVVMDSATITLSAQIVPE